MNCYVGNFTTGRSGIVAGRRNGDGRRRERVRSLEGLPLCQKSAAERPVVGTRMLVVELGWFGGPTRVAALHRGIG